VSGIPRELRRAQLIAEGMHWTITRTGGGHLRWKPPQGKPVFTPGTPGGNNRSVQNSIAQLRRAGLPVLRLEDAMREITPTPRMPWRHSRRLPFEGRNSEQ
jgi:hypothetical protein